jgi:hypothetical protein
MPPKEAIGDKPQSHDAMLSLHESERRGRELHDVGTPLRIKQIGTVELMRKRLTIVAVADHAVHRMR